MKVAIIGGGVIGAAVAWRLAARSSSVRVELFEQGRIGREASWAAAGMLAPQAEAHEPGPMFELCLQAKQCFDGLVERLIAESGVDPEYDREGIIYVALSEEERVKLEARARWQSQAGAAVEELTTRQALGLVPQLSEQVLYALYLPTNHRLENRKLVQAYAGAAAKAGVLLHEGARVARVITGAAAVSALELVDGSSYPCDVVVNAAGAWAGGLGGIEADGVRTEPVRGQIVCFGAQPGTLPMAVFSEHGYAVPRRDGRILAGSTMERAGFDKSVTLAGLKRIATGMDMLFPGMSGLSVAEIWAGLRPAPPDLLPVIGPSPKLPGLFYAAGHFRSGILLSALTGELVADLVLGRKPAVDLTPFAPGRLAGNSRPKP